MTISFTEKINDSFFELNCNNDPFEAIEYLNNPENFRSFSAGLTELMIRCSYNGNPESLKEKKAYLSAALSNIGASVTSPTIKSWFIEGTHPRFNEHSRENMFLICFALNASLEDVNWFFSHVYFDRCFNYHCLCSV